MGRGLRLRLTLPRRGRAAETRLLRASGGRRLGGGDRGGRHRGASGTSGGDAFARPRGARSVPAGWSESETGTETETETPRETPSGDARRRMRGPPRARNRSGSSANGSAARGAPTVDAYAVDSYPSSPFSASCDS